jgi:hypothetical protein
MQRSIIFHYTLTLGLLALLFTATCVQPPNYPIEPVIAFKSLSKTTMLQTALNRRDSIQITFTFTDGDGDLGFTDTTTSVFIRDGEDNFSRLPYRIPYIEQQGAGNGISGEITLIAPTVCCKYFDPVENIRLACRDVPVQFDTTFFLISIKDRAGHRSNEIKTAPIRLICKQ